MKTIWGLCIFLLLIVFSGCENRIKNDKIVKMHFIGKLDDGSVFDSSYEANKPLEFVFGQGMIIPGLEKELKGLIVGSKKEIRIKSKNAYGSYNKSAVYTYLKTSFPKNFRFTYGKIVTAKIGNETYPAKIIKIENETVTVDLNHALAGKNLTFFVEILEINEK